MDDKNGEKKWSVTAKWRDNWGCWINAIVSCAVDPLAQAVSAFHIRCLKKACPLPPYNEHAYYTTGSLIHIEVNCFIGKSTPASPYVHIVGHISCRYAEIITAPVSRTVIPIQFISITCHLYWMMSDGHRKCR